MIWVRKVSHDLAEQRHDGLARAFSWLLFQTCFFGIACFIILQIAGNIAPAPTWIQPMALVALIGFAGGILGALIVFALLSARNTSEE